MEIRKDIINLPVSQQMALWVILNMNNSSKGTFSFLSSEFIKDFNEFSSGYTLSIENATSKSVGGLLSALLRNGVLMKLSGDRDKMWTLSDRIKKDINDYKVELANILLYWS